MSTLTNITQDDLDVGSSTVFRPPDWGWRRAIGRHAITKDEVVRARRYIRRYRKIKSKRALSRLVADMPDVHGARILQFGPNKRIRWLVEAMLLADVGCDEIAYHIQVTDTEVISMFERLFFNVRDYAANRIYFHAFIVPSPLFNELTEADMLKLAAFYGGEPVLWATLSHGQMPADAENFIRNEIANLDLKRSLALRLTCPVTDMSFRKANVKHTMQVEHTLHLPTREEIRDVRVEEMQPRFLPASQEVFQETGGLRVLDTTEKAPEAESESKDG